MEDVKFDCIIVGGGIAGLSAALTLARNNCRFLLIERGEFSGAKNVSGGVLWGTDLAKLIPDYWDDPNAGYERFITHRRLTFMDGQSAFSLDFKSDHFREKPYTGLVVLRARFDHWLAQKVEEAIAESSEPDASYLAHNILVDEILMDGSRAAGIRAGDETFYAECIILAEGVNNLLTRQTGLQASYVPADHLATGVKEVIRFNRSVLEDRFQLDHDTGMSNEFVGFASDGVEGGGFLYTNKESISLGLVLGMKDLRDKKKKPQDILNHFKSHPAIKDILKGGEVIEYSAHAVSTGDMRVMPKELYSDGIMIAGEAANLLMNSGKAIQGMDYAMRSGILAAETVVEAKITHDFSKHSLKAYRDRLEESYVMKDMRKFQSAVSLLHQPETITVIPEMACDFGRQFFSIRSEETPKTAEIIKSVIKQHSSYWNMIKLGIKGVRSL